MAKRRKSHEQQVIDTVMEACASILGGLPHADDVASDIIERMWRLDYFGWEISRVRAYARKTARGKRAHHFNRHTRSESEFGSDDAARGGFSILERIQGSTPPMQHLTFDAHVALSLAMALPDQQRDGLLILAGGGSPIDVATELKITPWEAIRLIKEARENVHRVDPFDDLDAAA